MKRNKEQVVSFSEAEGIEQDFPVPFPISICQFLQT